MIENIDINETKVLKQYLEVLEMLLKDHTTQQNIYWVTDSYADRGESYQFNDAIVPDSLTGEFFDLCQEAYKNTYGYEWQGDNLLLAREALLFTFLDYYRAKFGEEPQLKWYHRAVSPSSQFKISLNLGQTKSFIQSTVSLLMSKPV